MDRLSDQLAQNWQNAPPLVQLQTSLTAGAFDQDKAVSLLSDMAMKFNSSPVMRDAILSSLKDREYILLSNVFPRMEQEDANQAIFLEMLATAVTNKGDAGELSNLLALIAAGNDSLGRRESAILTGMANHTRNDSIKIELAKEPQLFAQAEGYDQVVQSRLKTLGNLLSWPGKPEVVAEDSDVEPLDEEGRKQFALGRRQFLNVCSGCHGTDGGGMRRFAPPLHNSEWVLGDEKRLSLILLHGMEGPVSVAGKEYNAPEILPVMPSFSTMDNVDLAAIMTYIRREWGHTADPVSAGTVGGIRYRSQGKVTPWRAEELMEVSSEDVID
jgi:mono/diheme cytochrome c family protein